MSRRLTGWILAGVLLTVAGAWAVQRYSASVLLRTQRDGLSHEAALLSRWVGSLGAAIDPQTFAEAAGQALLARVTLIDETGVVLGDSSLTAEGVARLDNHAGRPEVVLARSAGAGTSVRRSDTTNVTYLYSARLVERDGPVRYVRIAVGVPDRIRMYRPAFPLVLVGVGTFSLVLLGFGYLRHRRVVVAVDRLASRVENGNSLDAPVMPELERLSAAVRREIDTRSSRLRDIESASDVLANAIDGMQEGLLLIDPQGRIRLVNRTARVFLAIDFDPLGLPLSQVVRHPTLLTAVEEADAETVEGEPGPSTVEAQDRVLEFRTTTMRDAGVLVLLIDVTELHVLQRVRREFISNVSHELRTPLTAIKAAVETLLDEDRDSPFAAMIQRNAEAMEDLLEDLTDLSLIETQAVPLEIAPLDLVRLVEECIEQVRPIAGAIRLSSRLSGPLSIRADKRRLRQILVNLLDNAIKFNRPDGRVDVEAETANGWVVLRVRDSGIGIPAAQLDQVFHRFYQVAPERSRERPGSGLGLAIVKHLARLHGGNVEAESEVGVGSTFTLRLPLDTSDD